MRKLVTRLRDGHGELYEDGLCEQAADRIEELEQELEAIKQILLTLSMRLSSLTGDERDY